MRRVHTFSTFVLLCLFSASGFSGDEQSFSISKNVAYENYPVRVAVNTNTGDVLVVWLNLKTADNKRLYAALCKLGKSGTFKAKAPRMLSGADSFIWGFDVAYNPLDDSFMVAYDAHEGGYDTPMNLWSLKLDGRGKPVGQPIQLTPAGTNYLYPAITFVPGIPSSPPSGKGNYLIAYDRPAKTGESDQPGVYTTFLDHNGNLTGAAPRLVSPEINWHGFEPFGSLPLEFTELEGGGFVLALRKNNVNGAGSGFLLRLDSSGQAIKQVELGDYVTMIIEFIQLSNKICVLSWNYMGYASPRDNWLDPGNGGECRDQLYRPSLQKVRQPFNPLDEGPAYVTELVKLNDDPGGYQLASDGESLLGRYINKGGKLSTQTAVLFDHQDTLNMMDAVCLPGANRIFVAWVVREGGAFFVDGRVVDDLDHSEVKGFVFDAK